MNSTTPKTLLLILEEQCGINLKSSRTSPCESLLVPRCYSRNNFNNEFGDSKNLIFDILYGIIGLGSTPSVEPSNKNSHKKCNKWIKHFWNSSKHSSSRFYSVSKVCIVRSSKTGTLYVKFNTDHWSLNWFSSSKCLMGTSLSQNENEFSKSSECFWPNSMFWKP